MHCVGGVMADWHVQYQDVTGKDRLLIFLTPERAIEVACALIDQGEDVCGIGTGPFADSINRELIARIYAIWVRTRNLDVGANTTCGHEGLGGLQ